MPILYTNKKTEKTNMKTIQEMPAVDAIEWIKLKNKNPLDGYTMQEATRLTDLVRAYIDPKQRGCAYCGTTGSLREAKDKFVQFYIDNEANLTLISQGINPFCECTNEQTLIHNIETGETTLINNKTSEIVELSKAFDEQLIIDEDKTVTEIIVNNDIMSNVDITKPVEDKPKRKRKK